MSRLRKRFLDCSNMTREEGPKLTADENRAANLLVTILNSKVGMNQDTAAFRFVVKGCGLWKAMKSLVKKLGW